MPRIRTIHPRFPHVPAIGRLTREARLFFILLWTQADDAGRLACDPDALAEQLFPFDGDVPVLLPRWIEELEAVGCVERYSVDGIDYLRIRAWRKLQPAIQHPSRSRLPGSPTDPHEAHDTHEERPRRPMARASKADPHEKADFLAEAVELPGTPGEFPPERMRALLEIALRKSLAAPNAQAATARFIEIAGKMEQEKKERAKRSPSLSELHGLVPPRD